MSIRLPAAALAALLALGACAAPAPVERPARTPAEEEILRRQARVAAVGAAFPFLWEPEVLDVLRRTGDDIVRAVGASPDSFHYYVIDKPVLNAFTSPTGEIFFFSGQLAEMRTRSELAGVLAHEIAHVRAGHYERIQRSAALGTVPALAAVILSGGSPEVLVGALSLLENYQLNFSREMESEADRLSLVYLGKTSYDPRGLLGALGLIEVAERFLPTGVPVPLRSHPLTQRRIASLEGAIGMAPGETYRPGPDPAWDRIRAILLAGGEPERALREFGERAASEDPRDLALLGLVHLERGDVAAAVDVLGRANAGDAAEPRAATDYGAALWAAGEAAAARRQFERALQLPGGAALSKPHFYLGEILRAEGRKGEALERYRLAAALSPPLPEAHYQLALGLSEADRLGEADFHFGRAAALRGDFVAALASLRRARRRLGADPDWAARIDAELRHME